MFFFKSEIAFTVAFVFIIISISTFVFSFKKIYRKLRRHQLQVHTVQQGQPNGRQAPLNIAPYKKLVSCVLWVQLTVVICYVSFIVEVMLMIYGPMPGRNFEVIVDVTATLTCLRSSLNPIIYCCRIRVVQQAAKETIKKLICGKSV